MYEKEKIHIVQKGKDEMEEKNLEYLKLLQKSDELKFDLGKASIDRDRFREDLNKCQIMRETEGEERDAIVKGKLKTSEKTVFEREEAIKDLKFQIQEQK